MKKKLFAGLAVGLFVVGQPIFSNAAIVTFNDFSDTSGLALNGNTSTTTTTDGVVLRLTPATGGQSGSAFSSTTLNASTFSTYFEFRITNPGGSRFDGNTEVGADGLVFVIQSVSSSIGGGGGGIGYSGISNSVGIEFDTWHNSSVSDPNSNHIGIDTNGSVSSLDTVNVSPNFDDSNIWYSWIDYDGTNLEVRANQTGLRPTPSLLSYTMDMTSIIGAANAYVGFTSGTGADWGNHDIISWEYRDEYNPIDPNPNPNPIPEPATMLLFGTGLAGLVGVKFRKKKK